MSLCVWFIYQIKLNLINLAPAPKKRNDPLTVSPGRRPPSWLWSHPSIQPWVGTSGNTEKKPLRPQSTPQNSEGRHLPWAVGFIGNWESERVGECFFLVWTHNASLHGEQVASSCNIYWNIQFLLFASKYCWWQINGRTERKTDGQTEANHQKCQSLNWQFSLGKWLTVCTSQMMSHPPLFTSHFSQSTNLCLLCDMWPLIITDSSLYQKRIHVHVSATIQVTAPAGDTCWWHGKVVTN